MLGGQDLLWRRKGGFVTLYVLGGQDLLWRRKGGVCLTLYVPRIMGLTLNYLSYLTASAAVVT